MFDLTERFPQKPKAGRRSEVDKEKENGINDIPHVRELGFSPIGDPLCQVGTCCKPINTGYFITFSVERDDSGAILTTCMLPSLRTLQCSLDRGEDVDDEGSHQAIRRCVRMPG